MFPASESSSKASGGFQYRLRFFHKCRSPGSCDPGQIDRYQIQGCALESSCGAPVIVVLVRYRHDPESGLSKECHRAQFPPGRSPFSAKAIVVPSDRVLEYMDQPLLLQPRLADTQGRNLIGGPDVSPSGEIYATPLESNGIAHLNNFCIMFPWSDQDVHRHEALRADPGSATGHPGSTQRPDAAAATSSGGGASGPGSERGVVLGEGSRVVQCGSDGPTGPGGSDLCLLVQLLRRDPQQRGRWFAYDMPHLVSRPFQVLSHDDYLAMHYPLLAAPASAPQPHSRSHSHSAANPSAMLPLPQPHPHPLPHHPHPAYLPGGGCPRPLSGPQTISSMGAVCPGPQSRLAAILSPPLQQQQQQQQQYDGRMGAFGGGSGGGGPEELGAAGFVLGGAVGGGGGRASGGGAADRRRSSASGGSPNAQRNNSRARRRSCLSKDSSHDDCSAGAPSVGAPAGGSAGRTRSGASAGDAATATASGPLLPSAALAAAEARAQAGTPCSMAMSPQLQMDQQQQHLQRSHQSHQSPQASAAAAAAAAAATSVFTGSAGVAMAQAAGGDDGDGTGGAGVGGGASGEGAADGLGGLSLGLAKASSAILMMDINMAELFNGVVDAQHFFADDAMEVEGASKRAKSNSSAPCPPSTFLCGNSSSNTTMATAASPQTSSAAPAAPAAAPSQHQAFPDPLSMPASNGGAAAAGHLNAPHGTGCRADAAELALALALAAGSGSCNGCSDPGGDSAPFMTRHADCSAPPSFITRRQPTACSGSLPFVTRQSECGGSSGGALAGGGGGGSHGGVQAALLLLARQSEGGGWSGENPTPAPTPTAGDVASGGKQSGPFSGGLHAGSGGGSRPHIPTPFDGVGAAALGGGSGSSFGAAASASGFAAARPGDSQLDALMQLLGQPGAMQEVLDRMEQDQEQERQERQHQG